MNTLLAFFSRIDFLNKFNTLTQFHWLRPLWLLAIIPALALAFMLWRRKSSAANWRAAIAPDLIDYLLESTHQVRAQWPWLLLFGWLVAVLALAGPTWEKLPQPVLQKRDGLVIVLDLSLSMYAEDIKPSRLQRARYKIIDILQQRREGLTGLVAYSGDAHIVSPLTDDTATIANLVPALAPAIMPSFGSNVSAGIDSALQLLRNSGFERGRILLITDGIDDTDVDKIATRIDGHKWQLSVIGVGTEQGAPIPLPNDASQSGFLKQNDGTIAIAQLHRQRFNRLVEKVHGRYADISVDDSDIAHVLPPIATTDGSVRTIAREFDQWRERGPLLVIFLLPFAAFAFRRGWLLLLFLIPFSTPSHALEWRDLWLRPDQQAQQDFNIGNTRAASEKFQDPNWRGIAQYRSGDFDKAAQSLAGIDSAEAQYNRGNALAQSGKLQEAINAYDAALKRNPRLADAKANRDLVENLLKQQKQKNQQNKSQQQNKPNGKKQDEQQKDGQSQQGQSQNNQSKNQQSQGDQSQQQPDGSKPDHANPSQQQNTQNNPENDRNQSGNSGDRKGQQNAAEPQKPNSAQTSAQSSAGNPDNKKPADTESVQEQNADKQKDKSQKPHAIDSQTPEQQRQQRATEQWLRQIPDDPSGLLRRKFLYESRKQQQQSQDDGQPIW